MPRLSLLKPNRRKDKIEERAPTFQTNYPSKHIHSIESKWPNSRIFLKLTAKSFIIQSEIEQDRKKHKKKKWDNRKYKQRSTLHDRKSISQPTRNSTKHLQQVPWKTILLFWEKNKNYLGRACFLHVPLACHLWLLAIVDLFCALPPLPLFWSARGISINLEDQFAWKDKSEYVEKIHQEKKEIEEPDTPVHAHMHTYAPAYAHTHTRHHTNIYMPSVTIPWKSQTNHKSHPFCYIIYMHRSLLTQIRIWLPFQFMF